MYYSICCLIHDLYASLHLSTPVIWTSKNPIKVHVVDGTHLFPWHSVLCENHHSAKLLWSHKVASRHNASVPNLPHSHSGAILHNLTNVSIFKLVFVFLYFRNSHNQKINAKYYFNFNCLGQILMSYTIHVWP